VAAALRETALLLEARGENRFKVGAYERGARALEALSQDLGALVSQGRLREVPGIGDALAATITEIYEKGASARLERLRAELPPGVLELARVPGLSPAKIGLLHKALGIRGVKDLEAAAEAGRVREVRGFGPVSERKLLAAIRGLKDEPAHLLLHEAWPEAERFAAHLRGTPAVTAVEIAGALRRGHEWNRELVLVAAVTDEDRAFEQLRSYPMVTSVVERAPGRCRVALASGPLGDVHFVTRARFGLALLRATGTPGHLEELEQHAEAHGTKLAAAATEAAVYKRLGLPLIPPELREGHGEVARAAAGAQDLALLELADVRGLVHCHTVFSDGKHTVLQMAKAADAMGMRYLTITDHSPTAHYAGGLTLDRLHRQWEEIDKAQEAVDVRLLRGTESDILADGRLDYPDAVLEQMDVVIASVHNRFKMDADAMTKRVVGAMRQPVFKVWGHALGRLLDRRAPFEVHMEKILDVIAGSRAAIEVNGDPYRLDMMPEYIPLARERGIKFVVSTDAHSTGALHNVRWGVTIARRGGLTKAEVLNTLPVDRFRRAVKPGGPA
jgi:DNA polymerase (family 10)